MLCECLYSFYKKDKVYSLQGIETNFYTGFALGPIILLSDLSFFAVAYYLKGTSFVSNGYNLTVFGSLSFFICLFCVDFIHYVTHWLRHKVNFLWVFHYVHHSDTKFNMTTNIRQSWFERFYNTLLTLPILFLGFSPAIIFLCLIYERLYQYFFHNAYIRLPGIFDYLFITPSNHRNHHDQNREYQDSNYGGVFSVWDRMFGTYTKSIDIKNFKPGIKGYHQDNFIKIQIDPVVEYLQTTLLKK
jgi:sterol desaturase/sphingolipid hydroxylase (fatty acid hydroxylase superfamily)